MATIAKTKQDVEGMSARDRLWDSLQHSYGKQIEETGKSYDKLSSQTERQALSKGMQRSSLLGQYLAQIGEQKIKAQNTIYDNMIADFENRRSALEQQEAEAERALELAQHRADCEALARIILAEANNLSEEGQRCMVDFIWNRVQSTIFTANTIIDVCNQPSQFVNYKEDLPVLQKYYDIAEDELAKIQAETSYRLLPPNMLFYNWTPYEIEFRSSFEITSKTQTWKVS